MKAFIGIYFKTFKQAQKAYEKLSDEVKKHKSLCGLNGVYFIVGNSTIEAFNKNRRKGNE